LTSEIPYERAEGLDIMDAVGGADAKGWKKRLTLYPNGKADVASSFLFLRTIKGYSGFANYCSGKTGS
jgi:hypothetical protein